MENLKAGDVYASWLIIDLSHIGTSGHRYWRCVCLECNEEFTTIGGKKKIKANMCQKCNGRKVGLGNVKHGLSEHPLYKKFGGLEQRCSNIMNKDYRLYGAKGIEVRFKSVEEFIAWGLANGFEPGLDLHRVDDKGHYSPDNCEFIPKEEHIMLHANA